MQKFTLTFLFHEDEDIEGMIVGHCLELNLVITDTTIEKCTKALKQLVTEQIKHHISKNMKDKLFYPSHPKYWAMLGESTLIDSTIKKRVESPIIDKVKYYSVVD